MQSLKATGLDRKSGGAQWRDLRFGGSFLEMFFLQRSHGPSAHPRKMKMARTNVEWVPGLKSETWATHSKFGGWSMFSIRVRSGRDDKGKVSDGPEQRFKERVF